MTTLNTPKVQQSLNLFFLLSVQISTPAGDTPILALIDSKVQTSFISDFNIRALHAQLNDFDGHQTLSFGTIKLAVEVSDSKESTYSPPLHRLPGLLPEPPGLGLRTSLRACPRSFHAIRGQRTRKYSFHRWSACPVTHSYFQMRIDSVGSVTLDRSNAGIGAVFEHVLYNPDSDVGRAIAQFKRDTKSINKPNMPTGTAKYLTWKSSMKSRLVDAQCWVLIERGQTQSPSDNSQWTPFWEAKN
ncbi:hypothetical protein GX48_08388 [Paracoccidioides brasiliensis]|nr:hypothetical protein GX48_08388 [Paracoccidioides brasiliensis]